MLIVPWRFASILGLVLALAGLGQAGPTSAKTLAEGLKNPESVAVGGDGRIYVSVIGAFDKDEDGSIVVLDKGKAVPFATGLDDPKGIAVYQKWLFVADRKGVWRIESDGKAKLFAEAGNFPQPPVFLNDVVVDPESGTVYVSDTGDGKMAGAVFSIDVKGKIDLVASGSKNPALRGPNGLVLDGASFLLVLDARSGELHRLNISKGTTEKVADGFGVGDGLAWDYHGRLFVTDWSGGKAFVIPRPGQKPRPLSVQLESAADLCYDPIGKRLLIPDMKAGKLLAVPAVVPGEEVDETPLPIATEIAFPKLKWTGWEGESETGLPVPLRPLVLTHAGDGSDRVFVATQQGIIHVFPNDQKADATKVFLDVHTKVRYDDKTNEEGFLGLAFHPRYKENGQFFAFYTDKNAKLTNVLSRFRVSKDDPNRADPTSEEELLRIERPFWNHDGGTLCFGPDGFLYVALGDGGSANDPHNNAQNLRTLLGSVLRLDVDRKDPGKAYGIPKDNPFVGRDDACPEIWAYGLRNIWRMAFDRKTGKLWAADVGQNLYEEIDILRAGGNFGWKLREGLHPFFPGGVGPRRDLIDPIWEYYHELGRSITGGGVYRGSRIPELQGSYLYGDYISCKLWALRYDEEKGRVVANRPLQDRNQPILSFGEDEKGDVYYLTYATTGQGIYRFVHTGGDSQVAANAKGRAIPFGEELLQSLPRRKVQTTDSDGKATQYEGVPVAELLRSAGQPLGKALRGSQLAQYLLAEAADGYRVVFSLAECDPSMGDNLVLLADRRDGEPLNQQEGPYRIIVPGDRRPSRWVRGVTRLTLMPAAGDTSAASRR